MSTLFIMIDYYMCNRVRDHRRAVFLVPQALLIVTQKAFLSTIWRANEKNWRFFLLLILCNSVATTYASVEHTPKLMDKQILNKVHEALKKARASANAGKGASKYRAKI